MATFDNQAYHVSYIGLLLHLGSLYSVSILTVLLMTTLNNEGYFLPQLH